LAAALAQWSRAVAADPWLRAWPVVVTSVVPVVRAGHGQGGQGGDRWWLVDGGGDGALPMIGTGEASWALLAVSGGRPVTLLAEIVPEGVRVVAPLCEPVGPGR
jgi:hypothetical protein